MANPLSGLTIRGRCLLAAGVAAAACAVVLNERGLLRVAVFVVVLPLTFALFVGIGRVRIAARRVLLPERVSAGDAAEIELVLWRTGKLPAGQILLEDGAGYALGPRPRFVVEQLPYHRTVSLRYPIRPAQRGVHQIGPLRATITDVFGLTEFDRELGTRSRLVVLPRVEPLHRMPSGAGAGGTDDGSARLHAGQGEPDVIVRQYRQGDDMRKVHWPSTARKDEIMMRVEEHPWSGGTTVLLDHRAAAHFGTGPSSSLEWAVSFAASACLHVRRAGHNVRLVSEHAQPIAEVSGDGGPAHDEYLLETLATLQVTHQRDITTTGDLGAGQELIAVLGAISNDSVHELARYRPRRLRSLAVLLDSPSWRGGASQGAHVQPVESAAELLRAAGWAVVVAGPDSRVPDVWAQLCAEAANRRTLVGGAS